MNENEKLWCKIRRQKDNARRYYLHGKVKELGFRLNPKLKTIYVQTGIVIKTKYIFALQKEFNYSVQTEIV